MTVRQIFYQVPIPTLVEKSEADYANVPTDLAQMRHTLCCLVINTPLTPRPASAPFPDHFLIEGGPISAIADQTSAGRFACCAAAGEPKTAMKKAQSAHFARP
jgi:hypothetical protein